MKKTVILLLLFCCFVLIQNKKKNLLPESVKVEQIELNEITGGTNCTEFIEKALSLLKQGWTKGDLKNNLQFVWTGVQAIYYQYACYWSVIQAIDNYFSNNDGPPCLPSCSVGSVENVYSCEQGGGQNVGSPGCGRPDEICCSYE